MYKDKVCEYHATKAVLSLESLYFAKAFTWRFMEASQNVIELHDDAPEHFDCFLKIIYNNPYSEGAHQDELNSASSAVGLYAVADKYDHSKIRHLAPKRLRRSLARVGREKDHESLQLAVKAHYEHFPEAESKVGIMITREALKHRLGFFATSLFQSLLR